MIIEFENLKKANKKIRKELDTLIGIDNPIFSPIWASINDLIENELKQEELCNE